MMWKISPHGSCMCKTTIRLKQSNLQPEPGFGGRKRERETASASKDKTQQSVKAGPETWAAVFLSSFSLAAFSRIFIVSLPLLVKALTTTTTSFYLLLLLLLTPHPVQNNSLPHSRVSVCSAQPPKTRRGRRQYARRAR